jgi:hypothetical protein
VPLYGDGRSGTTSATPTTFGGALRGLEQPALPVTVGESHLASQPEPPAGGGGGSTPTHVDSQMATAQSVTGVAPPALTGVAVGDLLIVSASASLGTTPVWAAASYTGWSIIEDVSTTAMIERILTRVADGTSLDTPPAVDTSATAHHIRTASAYRSASGISVESSQLSAASQTAQPAPTQVNPDANALAIYIGHARQVATPLTWTPGAGLTTRVTGETGLATTNNSAVIVADTAGPVAAGNVDLTATTSAATARAFAWAAVLSPGGGTPTQSGAVDATATATVGIGATQEQMGAVAATSSASVTIGGTQERFSAVASTASATVGIAGTRTQFGAVDSTAAATASIAGTRTQFGAVAATAGADVAIAGIRGPMASVAATAAASAAIGPAVAESGAVAATAAATVGIAGTRTQFGAVNASATTSTSIAGTRTQFGAVDASATATAGVAGIRTQFAAVAATAAATAQIGSGAQGVLNPIAVASAAIAASVIHSSAISSTAAASLAIAAIRTQLGVINPAVASWIAPQTVAVVPIPASVTADVTC